MRWRNFYQDMLWLILIISCLLPSIAAAENGFVVAPVLSLLLKPAKFNALITGKLNDTGIHWGGNTPSGNASNCVSNIPYPQDCHQGRDSVNRSHADDQNGHAGFLFIKINSEGENLPADASEWECVGDQVTGLMWEVKKTGVRGLHVFRDKFTWYSTNANTNGGNSGDTGEIPVCTGYTAGNPSTFCNTQAFTQRVNDSGLCGYSDWRMPTQGELISIVDYSRRDPAIDVDYFPNTSTFTPLGYWTATPKATFPSDSMYVAFNVGFTAPGPRSIIHRVRLVRGQQ